jgi:hypothetical protein
VQHKDTQKVSYTTPDNKELQVVSNSQHNKWVGKPAAAEKDLRHQAMTNSCLLSDLVSQERRTFEGHAAVKKKIDGFRFDFRTWHDAGLEYLKQQQNGTQYSTEAALSVSQLISQLNLSLRQEEVEDLAKRYCSSEPTCDRVFNNVINELVTITDDPRKLAKLCEESKKVTDANMNAEMVRTTKRLYDMSLTEPVDVANVMRLLKETEGLMRDLKWEVNSLADQRRAAIDEDENMSLAEKCHDEMLVVQAKIHKLHLDRLDTLLNSGLGETFLEELQGVCGGLDNLGEHMGNNNGSLLARVQKDLSALDQAQRLDKQRRNDDDLAFAKRQQDRYHQLSDLSKRQDSLWGDIEKTLIELARLGVERDYTVKQQIEDKNTLDESIAQSDKLHSMCAKHSLLLEEVQRNLEKEQITLTSVDKFKDKVSKRLEEVIDAGRKATSAELENERKEFGVFFRGYILNVGDLITAKERLLEDMESQMEDLSFYIQHARETLDPQLKKYQEERRELDGHHKKLKTKVESLKETVDAISAEFEPTERSLFQTGSLVVSPLVELHEAMASRAQGSNTARSEFKQRALSKLQIMQDDAEKVVEKARQAKSAKVPGVQVMQPLSPFKGQRPESAPTTAVGRIRKISSS